MNQSWVKLRKGYRSNGKKGPEILAITSGKGGVGKTNLCVNMACVLRQLGKRVLIIDADIHLGNVDLLMGMRPDYTIADVLQGTKSLKDIVTRAPGDVDVLPAASAVTDLLESEGEMFKNLISAFSRFQHDYDVVLVDTAAGISTQVLSFVLSADKIIVVATPDPASITDAYGIVKVITQKSPQAVISLVLNMVDREEEGESIFRKMNLMTQRFLSHNLNFGGSIRQEIRISQAIRAQQPVVLSDPNSRPTGAMKYVTRRIMRMTQGVEARQINLFEGVYNHRDLQLGETAS